MKKLIEQFLKFASVGIVAFLIDYGLMVFFTEVFNIEYLISATLSFIISVIFNYVFSMRYVYTRKETLTRRREFEIFVILSVVGLFLNDYFMWMLAGFIDCDYRIAKVVTAVFVSIWNFVSRRVFLDANHRTHKQKKLERAQKRESALAGEGESSVLSAPLEDNVQSEAEEDGWLEEERERMSASQ